MLPKLRGVTGRFASRDHGAASQDGYHTVGRRIEQVQGHEAQRRHDGGGITSEQVLHKLHDVESSLSNASLGRDGEEEGCSDRDQREHGDDGHDIPPQELLRKLGEIEFSLANADFVRELDTSREARSRFLQDYGRYIGKRPPLRTDNVLHFMAGKRHPSVWLIRHMLEHHKARMDGIDNAGRRPLTLAIEERKEVFIEAVLQSNYDDKDLRRILGMKTSDRGNGIHAAINAGLSPRLTIALINKVSDEVLSQKDGSGCTPLHRAVEYDNCTGAQIEVVRALLHRGDSALDEKTNAKLSVYQHHFSTRPRDEYTTAAVSEGCAHAQTAGIDVARGAVHNDLAVQWNSAHHPQVNVPQRPADHHSDAYRNAFVAPLQTRPREDSQVKESAVAKTEVADLIANELKLWYLRSTFEEERDYGRKARSHDTAVDFIYGDGQTRHICFNLLPRDRPLRQKALNRGAYGQFVFDTALQFVALGPFAFISGQTGQAAPERGTGRRDMVAIFQWLQAKGVKNIIKVVVDDIWNPPYHSDEAIIEALRPFAVEILDWSKPDLRPETVRQACGNVRKLYLSWSGLDRVLMAWGGGDGLANLPYLSDIYVRQTGNGKQLDSEEWTSRKLAEFENLLKSSRDRINAQYRAKAADRGFAGWPPIKVHRFRARIIHSRPATPTKAVTEQDPRARVVKDHQWLKTMDRFADAIYALPPNKYMKGLPNLPEELKRDVRVCLIDDGVDFDHDSISERMDNTSSRAFGTYSGTDYRDLVLPFYDSGGGHGTLMANMIARVCPYAKIASYRLDMRTAQDGGQRFTARSAADAVEYAAKQDFDIISMSWTVKHVTGSDQDNSEDVHRLRAALVELARNKLVFCSSPDVGNISVDELACYYPIGSGVGGIFRIGAATADNSRWKETGGKHIVDYILPGHEVRERKGCEVAEGPSTGASVSTALAAGLAALLIHLVRIAVVHTYWRGRENSKDANVMQLASLETIKSFDMMRRTFDMMANKAAGGSYVHVWGYFDQACLDCEAADDGPDAEDEKWRIILELARDIVPRRTWRRPIAGRSQTARRP